MPGFYSPGQVAFNSNPEMSQLISMLSPMLLSQFSGPNSFIPHMMPIMSQFDQLSMRNFQQQRFASMGDVAQDNTGAVEDFFLGVSRIFSDTKANDPLFQEQMSVAASVANSPAAKMILGQLFGADNVEALFHGSRGDVSALNSRTSQMAYFMTDPSGVGRMNADSMAAYSRGIYSQIYEPDIDVSAEEDDARSADPTKRTRARQRLRAAAQSDTEIVDDTEIVSRLIKDAETEKKTAALYKKYVAGGTETDAQKQAEALVFYDSAIKESGVLASGESSISQIGRAAEDRAIANARGFMAGQVGQLTEYLAQTGQVGSSIGTKSLADRVAAVAEMEVSDVTFERLSREVAKKRLSDTNNQTPEALQYRALTTQKEREAFIRDNADVYEQEIRATKQAAEAATAGGPNAPALQDVEKLAGFQNLAVNVDATKTAKTLTGYLDAVAAVRDIFGDNGDTNAPMPALIATLNALTGAAGAQISGQKIATQLRQMQMAAKEAGVGREELVNTALNAQAQAAALNLTDADALRATTGALLARKVMTEGGAFNTPSYGEYNAQQSQQLAQQYQLGWEASPLNRALTAMVATYESSPEMFSGTAVEAAVTAYRAGEETYVDPATGETVNLTDVVANQGIEGVRNIMKKSAAQKNPAADQEQLSASVDRAFIAKFNDRTVLEYTSDVYGTRQQAKSLSELNSVALAPSMSGSLERAGVFARLGINETKNQSAVARAIAAQMDLRARAAIELPTAGERTAYMQENAAEDIRVGLEKAGVDPAVAAAEATRLTAPDGIFGGAAGRMSFGEYISTLEAVSQQTSGVTLSTNNNVIGPRMAARRAAAAAESEQRAIVAERMALGNETTLLQRISDHARTLQDDNQKFTLSGLVQAAANTRDVADVLREIDPVMAQALTESNERSNAAVIDVDEINKAVEAAGKNKDFGALRELAQVSPDTAIVPEAKVQERLLESLDKKTDTELLALSAKYSVTDVTAADLQTKDGRDKVRRQLQARIPFYAPEVTDVLGPRETTVPRLHAAANKRLGQAAPGFTQDEAQAILDREKAISAGILGGKDAGTENAILALESFASSSAPKKPDGTSASFTDAQHLKLTELIRSSTPPDKKEFEALADSLQLPDDKKQAFVTQAEALARAHKMGGFSAAGIDRAAAGMEPKLFDAATAALPEPPNKAAANEAARAATEARKLANAGAITPDAAAKASSETAGQNETVSVLREILAAIRALGGAPATAPAATPDATPPTATSATDPAATPPTATLPTATSPTAPAATTPPTAPAATTPPTATPAATPDATPATATPPTATPDATPDATPATATPPTATPDATPDATPPTIPDATPAATPDATPPTIPDATPAATPDATPPTIPDATPAAAQDAAVSQQPAVTSDAQQAQQSATLLEHQIPDTSLLDSLQAHQRAEAQIIADATNQEKPSITVTTLGDLIRPPTDTAQQQVERVNTASQNNAPSRTLDFGPAADFKDYTPTDLINPFTTPDAAAPVQQTPKDSDVDKKINLRTSRLAAPETMPGAAGFIGPRGELGISGLQFESPALPLAALNVLPKTAAPQALPSLGLQQLPDPQTTASTLVKEKTELPAASQTGQQQQKLELRGRLTLDGLNEAVLLATGETAVQTDGAPIFAG